ncbi:MAG TPA: nitroreductase family protein [Methanocorpusculum sp.]|nr:nitroreductase family protein [Methanocorpusculum sp.]HJJ95585.1 nitroreductase family protein [Methanocorpusculum sp.]
MDPVEFQTFLATRKSVREYEEAGGITEEEKDYLLEAAKTCPTAGNLEAWDVVFVTDDGQLEAVQDAAGGQHQIMDSGCAVVVCANYVRSMSRYGDRGILYAVQDATIATTYMMLAAHAIRLHTCWIGAFDESAIKEALDLPPHIRPVAILAVGFGMPPEISPERMDAEDHAHYDVW